MKNIKVELIIKPEIDPRSLIGGLGRLTQLKKDFSLISVERGEKILKSIQTMGHTSLLEPITFGVLISNASRVFLGQIRTHRLSSFVSQSHQYQSQDNFPYVNIPEVMAADLQEEYDAFMTEAENFYRKIKAAGISKDLARYVIPPAARNDLFISANARQWSEAFFAQRLCRRNTPETRHVMTLILELFIDEGYGYLFENVGPACVTTGKCDQGKMNCGKPFANQEEMLNENIIN